MKARGGLITREDLRHYTIYRRPPLRGTYRGDEILTVPPPSAGGVALLQCLNVLEDYDVPGDGLRLLALRAHRQPRRCAGRSPTARASSGTRTS